MTINRYGHNSDLEFKKFDERMGSIWKQWFRLFGWWFVFCAIISLTFTGTLIYVAWHFISKYW